MTAERQVGILAPEAVAFAVHVPLAIVGGGACGMVAALAARDAGIDCLVLEREAVPAGNTALSSGMIPACCTKLQRGRGIADDPAIMAHDIQAKARGTAAAVLVDRICRESGPTVDWLIDRHGIELELVEGFLYPGHSRMRMHAPPSRTGAALIGALTAAAETAGADILVNARVTDLVLDEAGRVHGFLALRPDGSREAVGCGCLILASNGFGGNAQLVRRHIPAMAEALYFGHPGNTGDALLWGEALGAELACLGSYQGHGSVAAPHNILITWALVMEGGIQVNARGERFSDEAQGYSEQAQRVLEQPEGLAWTIYDERLHCLGRKFEDYRDAEAAGAIETAGEAGELAAKLSLPVEPLARTLEEVRVLAQKYGSDAFGRRFTPAQTLRPPYYGVRVTGALFHTQGGLQVDENARVLCRNGRALPNLFAGGGSACGISGPADWGYLSGNGLLTATVLGRLAGHTAAAQLSGC